MGASRSDVQPFAVAIHGGAGARTGRDYSETESHQRELIGEARNRLSLDASALDVVEWAVAEMEASGLYVAGRGSAPNSAGYVELDASIMDGRTRMAGAVAALRDIQQPIRVARRVMEVTPHVLLAGAGALQFAREQNFAEVSDPAGWYRLPVGVEAGELNHAAHGTVGAVALDRRGGLAAATSTGGTFGKWEGRIGDSPLIGAGTWADERIAISATGTGEHIIRAGGALAVACRLRAGQSLESAMDAVLADIKSLGGDAGFIAVNAAGEVAARFNSEGMKRALAGSDSPDVVLTF